LKEKILWIGLILVMISWAGNYFYFQSKQLEHPIFLDHYYEVYLQDETHLPFYYLSNKMDYSEVSYVLLDGIEVYPVSHDEFSIWPSHTPQFKQEFAHQYLKSVSLELPQSVIPLEEEKEDSWSFEEISVTFANGQTLTANIGKVNVYGKLLDEKAFESRISSGSNQHRSEEAMVATRPITVEAITLPFSEVLSEDVHMKVNLDQEKLKELNAIYQGGNAPDWFEDEQNLEWIEVEGMSINEEVFPLQLDKDDWMHLSMQFNPQRKSFLEFGVTILSKSDEGEPFIDKAFIIDHPYLTQQDINKIIEEKQGGRANGPSF
jgi:hypothetical protein